MGNPNQGPGGTYAWVPVVEGDGDIRGRGGQNAGKKVTVAVYLSKDNYPDKVIGSTEGSGDTVASGPHGGNWWYYTHVEAEGGECYSDKVKLTPNP